MDKHTKRQRWSTHTADTSSTALESSNEENMLFTRHERKISGDDSATLLDVTEREDDDSTVPTSAEDKLNAALLSMLSTANSLLISTMTARSDLARLQIMESALDEQLDRREERVLMEIENNEKMLVWMEDASKKLDRVLLETSTSTSYPRSPTTGPAAWSRSGPSDMNARHWRAPSTTAQVNQTESGSSLGYFDNRNGNASSSRLASKRLEKVLQRANSSTGVSSTAHSRGDVSPMEKQSSILLPPEKPNRPDLANRLGMPSSRNASPTAHTSLLTQSDSPPKADQDHSLSEFTNLHIRTPSITSESVASSREDKSVSAVQIQLTPQTPYEDLPNLSISPLTSPLSEDSRYSLNKRSMSSLRSPNAVIHSRTMSSGPGVSEATLNRSSWQQDDDNKVSSQLLGNRGALESLRKLSGGSSLGHAGTPSASPGWGGTFASWVGISSPSQ